MRARLAVLALVAAVAAGCTTMPTSGPIESHSMRAAQPAGGVAIAPAPPSKGASPTTIVEGFLHAMATNEPGYTVARRYLTAAANDVWHPERGTVVYADGHPPTSTGDSVILVAPAVGRVAADGSYAQASDQVRHDFGVVKDADGEWRISDPPEGLLLSESLFAASYVPVVLYFLDSTGRSLIPDQRFVPSGPGGAQEAIGHLLTGPRSWLSPVTSQVPMSLMDVSSVSIDSAGVANVVLNDAAANGPSSAREQLVAQIVWTMKSIEGVTAVRILTGNSPWTYRTSDSSGRVGLDAFPEFDPVPSNLPRDPYAVFQGRFGRLADDRGGDALTDVVPAVVDAFSGAVNADMRTVAAVTKTGALIVTARDATAATIEVPDGVDLVRPQYDRFNDLWSVGGGAFRVSQGGKVLQTTQAPDTGRVLAFRIAPDGDRIAVVSETGGVTSVRIGIVSRTEGAVAVGSWRTLHLGSTVSAAGVPVDIGWRSANGLAVLVRDQGTTSVLLSDPDGFSFSDVGPNQVSDLVELAATPGGGLLARSEAGTLYRFHGEFNWVASAFKLASVFYP